MVKSSPYVFVDSSYVIYYTAFSTLKWFKRQYNIITPTDGTYDPMSDSNYRREFEKRLKFNVFSTIQKNIPFVDNSKIYFVLDCSKKNIWRNHYFPQYKIKRRHAKQEISLDQIFTVTNNVILPSYQEQGMHIMQSPNAEADDIIAVCVMNTDSEHLIITNDSDICQLHSPNIKLMNLQGQELTIQSITTKYDLPENNLTPSQYLLMKIYMGDTSDEIPAVFPKCSCKTAFKLLSDKKLLEQKLQNHPEGMANLQRNMTLIDFREIPETIKQTILEQWYQLTPKQPPTQIEAL